MSVETPHGSPDVTRQSTWAGATETTGLTGVARYRTFRGDSGPANS